MKNDPIAQRCRQIAKRISEDWWRTAERAAAKGDGGPIATQYSAMLFNRSRGAQDVAKAIYKELLHEPRKIGVKRGKELLKNTNNTRAV